MWVIKKIISKGDYNYALVPEHPNATKNGYVLHHRVIAENSLGRLLRSDEIVHHINGNKKDNTPNNLEVMLATEHNRKHGFGQGRRMAELRCPWCSIVFIRAYNATFMQKSSMYTCCSNSCRGKLSRRIQLDGRITAEVARKIKRNLIREFRQFNG
jgi:hypothetical protein